MLSINWDDVIGTIKSMQTHLIVLGIALILAIVITVAVRRLAPSLRKLTRATTWVACGAVAVLVLNLIAFGPMSTILTLMSGKGVLTEETVASTEALAKDIATEGMVLLKNDGGALPLGSGASVNLMGWASSNPVYGGTGSGSMSDAYDRTTIVEALADAGISTNDKLTAFYTDYREDRPVVGMMQSDWTLPEPPVGTYPSDLIDGAKQFSDTAVVVVSRSGGEGWDLPGNVNQEVADNKMFSFTNNSTDYTDFKDGDHYLRLTQSERDMIDLAKANFDKVVFVYNGAGAFELGDLQRDPDIDAIVWAIPPGQVGFDALGKILTGDVNPSAKTPDIFLNDITTSPAAKNFGRFVYDNMNDHAFESFFSQSTEYPSFVNYVEGIYVGYKFWETAAVEGVVDYDASVVYPFGYGLSYTSFEQKMGPLTRDGDTVRFDVTVTNTGSVAGKDVVEVYANPPYTNGGIEKAAVNLVAFDKTDVLEPGASQTLPIEIPVDRFASYDENGAKAYVLEDGTYEVSLRSDSHTVIASQTFTVDADVVYNAEGATHDGDVVPATNQFDMADNGEVTFLSRANGFANLAEATAAPTSFTLSDEQKAKFIDNSLYNPADYNNDADQMPTTGADNGLVLGDLVGKDYDDPMWDQLLDQMTFEDMDTLIATAGYQTAAVKSVGKIQLVDVDGPMALNNNFTRVGSIGLPISTAVAASWNEDLAQLFGETIGKMAHDMNVAGWYAPAMNTHRYPLAGRNFEYFSEDGFLGGVMAAAETRGAQSLGVYVFIKHFAFNDQEGKRNDKLLTWSNEQALREIYLRPFELAVKEGGAQAVMSAFNYVGPVYAGATPELLQTVLRDEWGFHGFVLTDYFGGYGYQNADQIIRNGGDAMLAPRDSETNHVADKSATSLQQMRRASHNILYTAAQSWLYADGQPSESRPVWHWIAFAVTGIVLLALVGAEVVAVRRFGSRRRAEAKAVAAE